jgi:large repetitive protein
VAFTTSVVDANCGSADGSIEVTSVSGGTAPYQYSIDGGVFDVNNLFASLDGGSYLITVQDANGCTVSASISVNDNGGPTAISTSILDATCGLANGSLEITSVTDGTAPYEYSFDGGAFSVNNTFSSIAAGTFTVAVQDANGCSFSTSVTINDTPGPVAFTTSVVDANCGSADGSIEVTSVDGGTAPYQYSIDGGVFDVNNLFASLDGGSYSITVQDANGCTVSASISVNDNGGPTAISTSILDATCGLANGSLEITSVTDGTAPYEYSFDGGAFSVNNTFSSIAAGTFTIAIQDANGCSFATSVTINDTPGPVAFTTSVVDANCGSADGSIEVTSVSGGTAPYQYSIDGGVFDVNNLFASLDGGSYSITVQDANGCTVSASISVNDNGGPTAISTSILDATCGLANGSLEITSVTDGTAPYEYSFDGGAFSVNNTFSSIAAGTFTIAVQDANGCSFSTSVTINDTPGPVAFTTSVVDANCGSADGSIEVTSVDGGTAPYQYSIDGGVFDVNNLFASLDGGSYSIIVQDANGCTVSASISVNDNGGPTAISTSILDATCGLANGSLEITSVTDGTAPYEYSFDGGAFSVNNTFSSIAAGTFTVAVQDANGCSFSTSVTINDTPGPVAFTTSVVDANCGSADGSIEVTSVDGGTAPYQYSIDGGVFDVNNLFASLDGGSYSITVQDANGCTVSASISVNDNGGPTAISTSILDATCGLANGSLEITSVTDGTAPYEYSFDGGAFSVNNTFSSIAAGTFTIAVQDANGCSFSTSVTINDTPGPVAFTTSVVDANCGSADGSIEVTSVDGGTAPYQYSIDGGVFDVNNLFASLDGGSYLITVQDANGCTVSASVAVNSTSAAIADAGSDVTICEGENAVLTATGGNSYNWNNSAGNTATVIVSPGITTDYIVEVTDANGCTASDTVTVIVNSLPSAPVISANGSTTFCDGDNVELSSSYSSGNVWTTGETTATIVVSSTQIISVTHTDINGCSSTSLPVSIISNAIPSNPVITAAGATTFCDGDSVILISSYGSGNLWNSGETNSSITVFASGVFNVIHTDVNGCTSVSSDITVTVNPLPATPVIITNSGFTSCDGDSILLASSYGFGNVWSNGSTGNIIFATSNNTFTVTHTNANGCSSTSNPVSVSFNSSPSVTFSLANPTVCENDGPFIINDGNPTGGSLSGIGIIGNVFYPSIAGAGTHIITYTVTNPANGCQTSATDAITVNAASQVSITAQASVCEGDNTINLSALPLGGVFNGVGIIGSDFVTNNLPPGTYTYGYEFINPSGCISSGSSSITIIGGVQLAVFPINPVCINSNPIVLNNITPAGGIYSGNGIASNVFDPSVAGVGTHTITYQFLNPNGCNSTTGFDIVVNDIPVVAITSPGAVCNNSNPLVLNQGTPAGGVYNAAGTIGGVFYPTLLNAGTYPISYIYTDVNGCSGSASDVIEVLPIAPVTITNPGTLCNNGTAVNLVATPSGGVFSGPGISGNSFDPAVTGAGNFIISYEFTDSNGCSNTQTEPISVESAPALTFGALADVCLNTPSFELILAQPAGGTYSGSGISNNEFDAQTAGVGQHVVTYQYTSVNGCTSQITQTITVTPLPAVSHTAYSAICADSSPLTLNNGLPSGGNYSGDFVINGIFYPNLSGDGIFTINYSVTDLNGCSNSLAQSLTVNPLPAVTVSSPGTICGNSGIINLTGGLPIGGTYLGNGVFNNQLNPAGLAAGNQQLGYSFTDGNGCTSIAQTAYDVTILEANAGIDITTNCGIPVNLNGSVNYSGANQVSINWSPSNELSNSTILNPIASPSSDATYTLTVSDGVCQSSDEINVIVNTTSFGLSVSANQTVFTQPPFIVYFTNNTPNANNYNFVWDFGDGNTFVGLQPPYHQYSSNGFFTVTLTATPVNGAQCSDTLVLNNWIYTSGGVPCAHNAIINQSSPLNICENNPVTLTCNTGPGFAYQWNINGIPVVGATSSSFTPQTPGFYSVTITANSCALASQPVAVNFLTNPPVPVISASGSIIFCNGGSVDLSAPTGYDAYLWSNGATSQSINVTQAGLYFVSGFGANGCSSNSAIFEVNNSLFLPPQLCMVTVDETTNKNKIVWEPPVTTAIDSFIVFRETGVSGQYSPIGAVSYYDLSEFDDTSSTPFQNAHRYRLAIKDTCGAQTLPGNIHRTIHLSINVGPPNPVTGNPTWNLVWNGYEGASANSYEIYRGTNLNNLVLIGTIAASSSGLNSWNDLNPPTGFVYYQIAMVLPDICESIDRAQYGRTRSNTGSNEIYTSILNQNNSPFDFSILPNPGKGEFKLLLDGNTSNQLEIEIVNSLGQMVRSLSHIPSQNGNEIKLDLIDWAKGVYYVRMFNNNQIITKKLVIN